jgi:S-adenosylmethionine decarboxylase
MEGCSFDQLNDIDFIENLIQIAAEISGANVLNGLSHKFEPQGVTAVCLLSESHISIHTYPEYGKCYADIYCCGDANPKLGCEYMIEQLKPSSYELKFIGR